MAIGVHVARVGVFNIDATGAILKKDDPTVTLKQQLTTSIEHLIIIDANIPNTASNPAVKAYLEAEANDDYVLNYMDQNTIVTYLRNSDGGFVA